jgi:hypothetical protein
MNEPHLHKREFPEAAHAQCLVPLRSGPSLAGVVCAVAATNAATGAYTAAIL